MSATPSSNLDSQLNSTRGLTSSFPEAQMARFGYSRHLWACESQPQFWTKHQVWEWLQQVVDMYQIDTSNNLFQNFDMDGHQLCNLSYNDFSHAAGGAGPFLFHSITELKWAGKHHVDVGQMDLGLENYSCPFPDVSFPPGEFLDSVASICPLKPVASSKSSPDIKRSSSGPDRVIDYNPRGTHLWEFIRDILLNPDRNPGLIKWEDRTQGIFRFLKSDAVAKLWGKKKNNSSMTYEKLSRAMRYYYNREILERVDGRRLVYKFGRNARGWRDEEN